MAAWDCLFDPSDSTLNARIEEPIKIAADTIVEKLCDDTGAPVPSQVSSRSPISQARTPRPQYSHDSEGTGAVKREDGIVIKHEAARNIRTPKVEAQGKSMLAIPEFNGQSLTGNIETMERAKLSAKIAFKETEHTTPLTAEREALPLCSTFTAVYPDGPITIYSIGKRKARNVDHGDSGSSAHAESSMTRRKADAMQETCQPHQGNTAASRSDRRIRGLKERPAVQDLPNPPTRSPDQEVMPGKPCTTFGLHLYSKPWCDKNLQSVLSEAHSASKYYQSRNSHESEEVKTDEIEVQPAESNRKRRKIEHMQGLNSDDLSDYANVPHIPFVDNSRLPANIDRRGYPRVIHIEHFTEETNTDNLTMADFVATILFHHNPQTLMAFFDEERYPKFGFAARNPSKAQDFAIERERKKNGLVVKVHACCLTRTRG